MQPRYSTLAAKREARLLNVSLFTELTGLTTLPRDRQYWTLCNEQPDSAESEINQLIDTGFLVKDQFHGVDRDPVICQENNHVHPTAHWHPGEWLDVISETSTFNPSLVYLDTICFADGKEALKLLAGTMPLIPPGTVLLFNAMASAPRTPNRVIDPEALIRSLPEHVSSRELGRWSPSTPSYTYRASRTWMRTYAFFKETL